MTEVLDSLLPSGTPPGPGLFIHLAQTLLSSQRARAWTFLKKNCFFLQSSGSES